MYTEIKSLQDAIKKYTGLNCRLGDDQLGAGELPCFIIRIVGDDDIEEQPRSDSLTSCVFRVSVQLVSNSDERSLLKAMKAYEECIKALRYHGYFDGDILDSTTKEYQGNLLVISIPYGFRKLIQKET